MFTLYSADFIGNPGNCSYPHKTVVMNTDSMRDAVGHDYVCAEYKNHYRNSDNFLSADCLPVDCDNDHSEDPKDWITPADVLEAFPGVSLAIHYSRFISGQETDITEFDETLVKKLIEKITVFADHFTVEFKSGLTIDIEA